MNRRDADAAFALIASGEADGFCGWWDYFPGSPTFIHTSAPCAECGQKERMMAPVREDGQFGDPPRFVWLCPGCLRSEAGIRLRG